MKAEQYQMISDLTFKETGISLKAGREAMVSARMGRRVRELGLKSLGEYLKVLNADSSGKEILHFINSITTNTTHFFREAPHFDALTAQVKALRESGQRDLRIWCAASSTGEEPYTLAMTVAAALGRSVGNVRILATDIDTQVLAKAKEGVYRRCDLTNLPPGYEKRFFVDAPKDRFGEPCARVSPELRRLVTFGRLNLIHKRYPMKGPFDVVFLRNVMIYFNTETRSGIISRIAQLLRPDAGVLYVGHSESLTGCDQAPYERISPSLYRRRAKGPDVGMARESA